MAAGSASAVLKPEQIGGLTRAQAESHIRAALADDGPMLDLRCAKSDGRWACSWRTKDGSRESTVSFRTFAPLTGNLH